MKVIMSECIYIFQNPQSQLSGLFFVKESSPDVLILWVMENDILVHGDEFSLNENSEKQIKFVNVSYKHEEQINRIFQLLQECFLFFLLISNRNIKFCSKNQIGTRILCRATSIAWTFSDRKCNRKHWTELSII